MKIVVITGASGGLGRVLVEEFAANGWHVVGTGRSERPAEFGSEVTYARFDASNSQECESFWEDISQKYPDAEICLLNNAGGYEKAALRDSNPGSYEKLMDSCYFSSVYMTRALLRHISKACIINVISANALNPEKNHSAYGAAKAAQRHFFQSLQEELDDKQYPITNLYPKDIASHGPNPKAIDPKDLARLICEQAENETTYYLRDVTIFTR